VPRPLENPHSQAASIPPWAVASAMTMFPRSIAVAKIRRGCPCAVTALPVGPDGSRQLNGVWLPAPELTFGPPSGRRKCTFWKTRDDPRQS
jgi:hypothetical protein